MQDWITNPELDAELHTLGKPNCPRTSVICNKKTRKEFVLLFLFFSLLWKSDDRFKWIFRFFNSRFFWIQDRRYLAMDSRIKFCGNRLLTNSMRHQGLKGVPEWRISIFDTKYKMKTKKAVFTDDNIYIERAVL